MNIKIVTVFLCVLAAAQAQGGDGNSRVLGGVTNSPKPNYGSGFVAFFQERMPDVAMCSGAVINDFWILSAASCFSNISPSAIRYKTGDAADGKISLQNGKTTRYDSAEGIYNIIPHPSFSIANRANDIALVQTSVPLTNTRFVITPRAPVDYLPVTFSGYGPTDPNKINEPTTSLSQVSTTLQNIALCRASDATIPSSKLCTITDFACRGDQGGPLTYNDQLIGIISNTAGAQSLCGRYPYTTFTNVYPYRTWLIRTTGVNL